MTYVDWIQRFLKFHTEVSIDELGDNHAKLYLLKFPRNSSSDHA
ncbi:phage integrase N-terminal SAM-like domain-containing protein [Bathymodiolus platifrons methanotrophic gill symbiont]